MNWDVCRGAHRPSLPPWVTDSSQFDHRASKVECAIVKAASRHGPSGPIADTIIEFGNRQMAAFRLEETCREPPGAGVRMTAPVPRAGVGPVGYAAAVRWPDKPRS